MTAIPKFVAGLIVSLAQQGRGGRKMGSELRGCNEDRSLYCHFRKA